MVRTLRLSDNRFELLAGSESVRERVLQRARFLQGEWFLNQDAGVPYLDSLLGRSVANATAANAVLAALRTVGGVVAVRALQTTREERTLKLEIEVEDDSGQTQQLEVRVGGASYS